MKNLNLLWAVLLLLTACGKNPLPNDVVATNSRDNDGTTYIQVAYGDGTEQYFKVLSENTAEVVGVTEYFGGIEPPIDFGGTEVVIPSEISHNGQTYTIVGIGSYAFYERQELRSVEIPGTVQYVDARAFDFCLKLKTIKLPDGVNRIGKMAFRSCVELTTVELGSGLTGLFYDAFDDCRSLTTLVCPAPTPPEVLVDVPNPSILWNCPVSEIKVPAESVEAYKTAYLWDEFADRFVAL